MHTFVSPEGNFEIWDEKPEGYSTPEEWLATHPPEVPEPEPPTQEEIQKQMTDAIQRRLDAFAMTRGYDGVLSAASYATSTNETYRTEGQYCVQARDDTWAAAYAILADVMAGLRPMPTLEEVMAELPDLQWPNADPLRDVKV